MYSTATVYPKNSGKTRFRMLNRQRRQSMNKPTNLSASYDVDLAQKVGVVAAALFNKLVYLSRYTER